LKTKEKGRGTKKKKEEQTRTNEERERRPSSLSRAPRESDAVLFSSSLSQARGENEREETESERREGLVEGLAPQQREKKNEQGNTLAAVLGDSLLSSFFSLFPSPIISTSPFIRSHSLSPRSPRFLLLVYWFRTVCGGVDITPVFFFFLSFFWFFLVVRMNSKQTL
jgi:hypothetical protein